MACNDDLTPSVVMTNKIVDCVHRKVATKWPAIDRNALISKVAKKLISLSCRFLSGRYPYRSQYDPGNDLCRSSLNEEEK